MDPRLAFFIGSFFLTVGFSFLKGGAPERSAAAVLFFGLFATIYMQGPIAARFMDFDFGVFVVDSAMLALFIFLALFAERFWATGEPPTSPRLDGHR